MLDAIAKLLIAIFSFSAIAFGYMRWRRSGASEELLWCLLGFLSVGILCFDVSTQYLFGHETERSFFWPRQFLDTLVLLFCVFLGWKFYFSREH